MSIFLLFMHWYSRESSDLKMYINAFLLVWLVLGFFFLSGEKDEASPSFCIVLILLGLQCVTSLCLKNSKNSHLSKSKNHMLKITLTQFLWGNSVSYFYQSVKGHRM